MLKYFKIKVSVARFSGPDKPSCVPTLSTNTVLYNAIFVLFIGISTITQFFGHQKIRDIQGMMYLCFLFPKYLSMPKVDPLEETKKIFDEFLNILSSDLNIHT